MTEHPDEKSVPKNSLRLAAAAEAYLDAHSAEKFSLEKTAHALYVNGSYLLRVYKIVRGRTLLWYHHHIRCEKAKALLRSTDMSVSSVSETVGYITAAHFSHVFRKMTGTTPTDYRAGRVISHGEEG